MRLPKASPPVMRQLFRSPGVSREATLRMADCADGTLKVIAPNNPEPFVFTGAVGCCYSYPDCNPCSSIEHFKPFVQQHVSACAGDAYGDCYVTQSC